MKKCRYEEGKREREEQSGGNDGDRDDMFNKDQRLAKCVPLLD